ncbi:MAG: GntR family transcriptional regulator [Actinomycetota bacterium]|jgi:GntR family transcriptional regulator|nr:GntR family transcriptional regulator [Actinomycetota bacterium]
MEAGEFPAGRLLPSEAELSADYDASRVTIRKALDTLRDEGLVDSRQGFGWFGAGDPVRQALGRLGTIEEQLEASGATAERRILDFGFVKAPKRAREILGDDTVLRVRRLNLADGEPFARVTVWAPERFGHGLSRADVEARSFYELLPVEVGGATQTIGAAGASAADAALLDVPAGSPVLRCERVTTDPAGRPLLVSEFVFPAHRTEFVVDLPSVDASIAPSGLRLVE